MSELEQPKTGFCTSDVQITQINNIEGEANKCALVAGMIHLVQEIKAKPKKWK